MAFNFNSLADQNFTSTKGNYLRPYGIYKVNLTKIEKTILKGSKDPNAEYPVLALEFTGCDTNSGIFTSNLFIPVDDKDMERPTFQNSEGHDYNKPSRFENFQFTLMQIVHALNPAGEQKIKENASKIKTIDQFIDIILKALAGKDKIETNLKLVGRNNAGTIYASLPNACAISKTGELYPVNFIGEEKDLFFTNYEISQQKAYQNAKPTNMDTVDNNPDSNDGSEELDLSDIEL